jgi:N-acyl-D-amino-acid deacylase
MLNYLLPYEAWKYGPLAACGVIGEAEFRRVFKSAFDSYRLDLDHVRVAWSPSGERIDDWGKTLQQIVDESGKDMTDALLDYLLDEQLAVLCVMDEGDDKEVEPFVAHPRCMIGTDAIYQIDGKVHPRAYGSAGRWLGPLVRDSKIFTLEEAIRKMTSLSAETVGLEDRGVLAVGRPADIVVFDEVTINDNASFSEPIQDCDGIEHVLVNGVTVVTGATHVEITEEYPGQRIRYRK